MSYTSRQPGTTGGLMLALYTDQQDYLYANSPAAGFRVSLSSLDCYQASFLFKTSVKRF